MTNSYTLGKPRDKFGEIDFSKLRSGITKEELGIEEGSVLDSIWNSIDTNQEGDSKDKLDRQELDKFIEKIKLLCGKDTNLSKGEAKKFEIENGKTLGRKHKEELLSFLSKLSELTKGIDRVESGTDFETIVYEDGHTEQVKPDGSKIIISKDEKTITEKDANGNIKKETVKTDDAEIVTEYEPNSTNPKKKTITGENHNSTILYAGGKPIKQTTEITQTGEVQEFDYIDDRPVLRKTSNPQTGETQEFEIVEGQNVLKKTTNSKTGEIVIYQKGKPASRTVTTETEEGTRVSNTVYDGNNSTEDVSINGKNRYQKKIIDGNEYEVSYDENGNTTGVIVQNGESVKAIAEKFGVKPEDLVKANAHLLKGGKRNFSAGDEIVIPRKMQADEYAKAQEGRKDAEGAKAEYRAAVARRKAEAARREAERQAKIGTEIARGDNGYYVTQTSDGNLHYWNPQKQEITEGSFKNRCPNIYENVKAKQRGATQRSRHKYDTATIKQQSSDLAKKIHAQISGASRNEKTINMLRGITPENAAFVVSEYQRMYNVSLAKDIDDEWGLDLNTVKEHICKKLVTQAKEVGLKCSDYTKINNLSSLQSWINQVSEAIINKMSNATETYYATEAEETQRQESAEKAKTAATSAEQIVDDLIKNTSGWNDIKKIKAAIARIDSPEELKEVNRLLTLKGYPPTDKYSPIEHFIYDESDHSVSHTYNSSDYLEQVVQGWIDNGTLKGQEANQAQARMAARVLYDGGDGFGTNCDKIKKAVRMIKCPKPTGNREADNKQAREVYRLVNEMIKKHNTFYGLGSKCTDLLDYCKGEMWDSEVKYLNGILAETNAIQGEEKAQAIKDLTQEAVEGAGTDIEYLEQAIKGIDSPQDRKAVEAKLKEYCDKKGIKPQIAGQSYLQAILYDECDTFMGISTDHKEIRKFNEMLIAQGAYTEAEIINLRAEQAALQILDGNFDNIKDAVEQLKDPKVLAKVEQLLTTKGFNSLDEFLSKKLTQTKSDLVNAELASNNLLPNEKAADVAYRLIKKSDFNYRAQGIRAIRNEAVAKLVDEKLKQEGSSLAKVMEQFNKDKAEYKAKADFWDGLGKFIPIVGAYAEDISDAYRTNTDGSDNMFVEMDQAQNLTPEQKAAYARTVSLMEQKLAQMEKDYKAALDSQGAVSWAVNRFCEHYGIGTTREEIETRIEHDKETVRLLKLAAEGKLGKMVDGKTVAVTFEEVFKERNVDTNFDSGKVEKVENQAQMLVAMNYAKTNIAICWEELENGLNSSDSKRLSVAIIDTLEKLSNMLGETLTLSSYGYTIKDSIIIDSSGNPVTVDKLSELAMQLKRGLSDVAKNLMGKEIPLNTSSSKINDLLEESYNSKKESFKQEFKDAFGQDCPDEMVEDYISTIETGKMVLNMGAIIGAAILAPITAGGSLATFLGVSATTGSMVAAGVGTAAVSLGLNSLEHSTDANGWTNAEWTSDAEQAMWDGILTSLGMKVGMIADVKAIGVYKTAAENMLKKLVPNISAKTLDRASVCIARVRAMGYEVTSDSIQSLVQTYCQHGEFDEESFVRDLLISVAGNSVGHAFSGVSEVRGGKANPDVDVPNEAPSADAARRGKRDDIADGEASRKADQSHLNANERAMVDEGLEGIPTREELDAYQREHGYQEPTPEERAAIDENNARAAEADAEAHRIGNNVDDASADALRRARENAPDLDTNKNGLFKDAQGNEYTLTDGKITEIRTPDGRVISDELKIAKFTSKRNINPDNLEPVKIVEPAPQVSNHNNTPAQVVKADDTDVICNPNTPIEVDINSSIRIADAVDIDLSQLQKRFDLMQDGDSFLIGRTVNGPNDIVINNSRVSGEHLKIEKIDGKIYITDLASKNGTVLNTTKPNYAAKWTPDTAGKYNNATIDDFDQICDKYYDELRLADYSYSESVNPNIRQSDVMPDNYIIKNNDIIGVPLNGWFWRSPRRVHSMSDLKIVDRISLNVKADKNMLKELDKLMQTGEYINKNGQKVKIDVPEGYYKTPQTLDKWGSRHDPITMYFSEEVSKELQDAIADITEKYARKPSNGKALMNSLEGKPWIAHEAYTPAETAKALYEEAKALNPDLAQGICRHLGAYKDWNCSTGMYAAAKRMVDEYKMSLVETPDINPAHKNNSIGEENTSAQKVEGQNTNEPGVETQQVDKSGAEASHVNTEQTPQNSNVKSYSEMDENELFSEYQRLNNELKYGGLNQTEQAARVKELQKIQKELEVKGFSIENNSLVSKSSHTNQTTKPEISPSADRTARMGKSLSKFYTKIENAIDKMTDLKRFNKLLDKITTKFVDFKDDMKALLDKLYDKAQALGLSIKESIHDVYARVGIRAEGVNPLDKYTRSKKGIDMSKSHEDWMKSRKDLFDDVIPYYQSCWAQYTPKDQHHGAWKMHLYSVTEADWREMCDVIIPYLKEKGVEWKTFNDMSGVHELNGSKQQGKAFTIYPKNNEDMAQIAKDLDYIIRKNKLETQGSSIVGDNELGNSGRLFYRYEFNSGAYKDEILDLASKTDRNKYHSRYDANRGEGKYLADDMTLEDDIWRNFDPSDPNAIPSTSSPAQSGSIRTARLQKGQSLEIQGSTKLNLANTVEIDLNDTRIKARIDNLPEGGRLTIGREGDIRINDSSNMVSRVHVIIEKRNGRLYVIDNSTNGTTVRQTVKSAQSPAPSNANSATPMERMQKGQRYELQNYPKIKLANTIEIDLNDTVTRSRINNLRDGQQLTIGREGDIQINDPSNMVSRIHVVIERRNGKIYIIDNSTNGTSIAKNTNNRTANSNANRNSNPVNSAKAEAYAKFDRRAPIDELPANGRMLDRSMQYGLDMDNLPTLTLIDGTKVDLNSPEILNKIQNLPEGQSFTIGRSGDVRLADAGDNVSNNHILITRHNGRIVMKDISRNGRTACHIKTKASAADEVEVGGAQRSAQPSNAHNSGNAVQQSRSFNSTHKIPAGETVADGYKDGGRGLRFDDNGRPINSPSREIIVVDRTKDTKLQSIITDVKRRTANMSDKEKAQFLQNYIYQLTGDGGVALRNQKTWKLDNTGNEFLIGDLVTHKPSIAVCRHRSLLFKVLGDELGLNIELQRGNFYYNGIVAPKNGGGHAWNVIKFDDGTSAIFDAMHNKTSSITPGQWDSYANGYLTVKNEPLYVDQKNHFNDSRYNNSATSSSVASSKFGTPDAPNYGAIVMASTETDLKEALDFVEKMPDQNPQKTKYKSDIELKLQKIEAEKAKELAKWQLNNNVDCITFNRTAWKSNPNAQTNIKGIRPNEVQVSGNYTGYSCFTGNSIYKIDSDIRTYVVHGNSFIAYNSENNLTMVGITCYDYFGRPGLCNIIVKGQVSEADALALIRHLDQKGLYPKDSTGKYSTKGLSLSQLQNVGRRIQEEVAAFFS